MTIQINYKNSGLIKTSSNLILFVDEKFNIGGLKKYISNNEFSYISDLLKNSDLKKNLLFFEVSSKKTIFLVSIKKDLKTSDVESLGAKFVEVENDSDDGVGSGGYAKETSDAYKLRQQEVMKERISKSDLVITTALIPNRPAPVLIPKEMVEGMKPGSAIMDLASENGGNCELTKPDEIVYHNNVLIDGNTNFPSTMATDASQLFSKNIQAIIEHCHTEDGFKLDKEDEIIDGMLFVENGEIRHQPTKEAL